MDKSKIYIIQDATHFINNILEPANMHNNNARYYNYYNGWGWDGYQQWNGYRGGRGGCMPGRGNGAGRGSLKG